MGSESLSKAISEKADLLNELWKEKELDSKFEQEIKEFIRILPNIFFFKKMFKVRPRNFFNFLF